MAPSVYSIIQVVPDPARGERLNVGAIVVNDEIGFAAARIRPKTRQLGVLAPDLHHGFLADLSVTWLRLSKATAPRLRTRHSGTGPIRQRPDSNLAIERERRAIHRTGGLKPSAGRTP